jgi:hypothetical protein
MKNYADFELWVNMASDTQNPTLQYPLQILSSPAGMASDIFRLDLTDETFKSELEQVRSIDPNLKLRKTFGRKLFDALFVGEIKNNWLESKGRIAAGFDGLHLRLCIYPAELAALPWELIFEDDFLSTDASLGVSRYLPVPEPPFYAVENPLRILVTVQSPKGVPQINPIEVENLETVLKGLGAKIDYKLLVNPTVAEIQGELQKDFHVLHYLGHGAEGKLLLTDDDKESKRIINDTEFAQLFLGRRSLRLIVLNACNSSQALSQGLFSGIGPALVQKRIPAVVAMQYPAVQLDTASKFSQRFYERLAEGLPVDLAVNIARQFVSTNSLSDRDWSTPVLYLGTRNGQIMNLIGDDAGNVERAWHKVQAATQQDAAAAAALSELADNFKELAKSHNLLRDYMSLDERLRDVRKEFEECYNLVNSGKGFSIHDFEKQWEEFLNDSFNRLVVFIEKFSEIKEKHWFQSLNQEIASIKTSIDDIAHGKLKDQVKRFNSQLAQAESETQGAINQSITGIIALSNKSLGRLPQ